MSGVSQLITLTAYISETCHIKGTHELFNAREMVSFRGSIDKLRTRTFSESVEFAKLS